MEYRNPQYTADGKIDCEIKHPKLGWIPFTASPHDSTDYGKQIFEAAQDEAAPYEPPPEPTEAEKLEAERSAMVCSRFQAKAALSQEGLLADVQAAVEQADEFVQIAWADASTFRRNSPTIAAIAEAMEMSEEQVDDLFREAMKIEA